MPSEFERYVRLYVGAFPDANGTTGLVVLTGAPTMHPERVNSYEVGYRWQAVTSMTFDATAFHSRMTNLVGTTTGRPFVDSTQRTIIPIPFANSAGGKADGAEFLFTDTLTSGWNVALGYTMLRTSSMAIDGLQSSTDIDNSSPRKQLQLRSSTRLSRLLDLDASAYYVGRLGSDVPSYLRLDTQLVWKPAPRWELSLSGQNLLRARHREFAGISGEADLATDIQRTVNGKITWRF
jgi:iron complex outermembrane receptor protein